MMMRAVANQILKATSNIMASNEMETSIRMASPAANSRLWRHVLKLEEGAWCHRCRFCQLIKPNQHLTSWFPTCGHRCTSSWPT
jgi:hypothetical protein